MCRACGSSVRRRVAEARKDSRPLSTTLGYDYAGMFSRAVAAIVDAALLGIVAWLVAFQAGMLPDFNTLVTADSTGSLMEWLDQVNRFTLLSLAITIVYHTMLVSCGGRTLGGYVAGIRVCDAHGGMVFPPAALMRVVSANAGGVVFAFGLICDVPALVYASGFVGMVMQVGALMALWDEQKRTLHDKVAGTIVINSGWFGYRV
jgi:uncharacterized RDD family membrane protein YckC